MMNEEEYAMGTSKYCANFLSDKNALCFDVAIVMENGDSVAFARMRAYANKDAKSLDLEKLNYDNPKGLGISKLTENGLLSFYILANYLKDGGYDSERFTKESWKTKAKGKNELNCIDINDAMNILSFMGEKCIAFGIDDCISKIECRGSDASKYHIGCIALIDKDSPIDIDQIMLCREAR